MSVEDFTAAIKTILVEVLTAIDPDQSEDRAAELAVRLHAIAQRTNAERKGAILDGVANHLAATDRGG